MGRSDSQPPVSPRFVAFAWRYHRLRRLFAPGGRRRAAEGIGELVFRSPEPDRTVETTGSPRFMGNPLDHCPCSPTPAGPFTRFGSRCHANDAAPAHVHNEGSPHRVFSGLNHTAFDLAVYASQRKLPTPTQDSLLAAGPALPDGIGYPQGSIERFLSSNSSSLPHLPGARTFYFSIDPAL